MTSTAKMVTNKIASVRTVVANYSNDEILLVLEHNDYDVDITISDFLEGQANDILTQWQHTGSVKTNKAKKKKKMQKKKKTETATSDSASSASEKLNVISSQISENNNLYKNHSIGDGPNQINSTNHVADSVSLKNLIISEPDVEPALVHSQTSSFLSSQSFSADEMPSKTPSGASTFTVNPNQDVKSSGANAKYLAQSHSFENNLQPKRSSKKQKRNNKTTKAEYNENRKSQPGRNRFADYDSTEYTSIKALSRDLKQCAASLSCCRNTVNEELDDSYKQIKQVFEEVTSSLIDREVQLMRILDGRKEDVYRLLSRREKRVSELLRSTERASEMTSKEVDSLRRDIKEFVADRKVTEDLARSNRFVYEKKFLDKTIPNFGEIPSVKSSGSLHSVCGSTHSDMSTAASSLPDTSFSDISFPSAAKSLSKTAPDTSQSSSSSKVKKEASFVNGDTVEDLNWADSVDENDLTGSGASWANGVAPVSGYSENESDAGSQKERNEENELNNNDDNKSRGSQSRYKHSRSRGGGAKQNLKENRNGFQATNNGVSGDTYRSSTNRYRGGYRRSERADFHAIPPIPYPIAHQYNGYHSQTYFTPKVGLPRPQSHRDFVGPRRERDYRSRKEPNMS